MTIYLIRNTSDDRTKVTQHRSAPGFEPEPSIGGTRLRVGHQMYIEGDHFARIRDSLFGFFKNGVIEVTTFVGDPASVRLLIPILAPRAESNPHGVSNAKIATAPQAVEQAPEQPHTDQPPADQSPPEQAPPEEAKPVEQVPTKAGKRKLM